MHLYTVLIQLKHGYFVLLTFHVGNYYRTVFKVKMTFLRIMHIRVDICLLIQNKTFFNWVAWLDLVYPSLKKKKEWKGSKLFCWRSLWEWNERQKWGATKTWNREQNGKQNQTENETKVIEKLFFHFLFPFLFHILLTPDRNGL